MYLNEIYIGKQQQQQQQEEVQTGMVSKCWEISWPNGRVLESQIDTAYQLVPGPDRL